MIVTIFSPAFPSFSGAASFSGRPRQHSLLLVSKWNNLLLKMVNIILSKNVEFSSSSSSSNATSWFTATSGSLDEAFSNDTSKTLNQSQTPAIFNPYTLQQRLQILIEGASEIWTYGIFWQSSSDISGASILGWGDGFYKGEEDKMNRKMSPTLAAEQEHRKKVLRELCSLISGGKAFLASSPVWIAGSEKLLSSSCERAKQAQMYGLQTMVCIPSAYGVVEVGSTELIFQSSELMNKVRLFFNFNSIEIKDSVYRSPASSTTNGQEISKPIHFGNPSSSSLAENPSSIHIHQQTQTETFLTRELNFSNASSVRNSTQHTFKLESGEIVNYGESNRNFCIGNGNLNSNNPLFVAEEDKKKKRSPASRGMEQGGSSKLNGKVLQLTQRFRKRRLMG
ncbi:hypothetical protein HHK36_030820 [Tetracentron sinense]|uniref:Transcription factor n=1 Tax=Tetracentron sinense TaxID=13715 RepID=A0A835D1W8_TETSI|nr:hypothetical protein HHK36_030820 [Tetracentron sinense]